MQPRRAPLLPRLWLSFILLLQVFATPFVAFSLTYLLQFEWNDAQASLQFRFDMMPWITAASLSYGMLAFLLAAVFGGWRPLPVVERGGWAAALGFSRSPRQADLIRNARHDYAQSSHGRLALLTHDRIQQGHPITVTHGGLILLAVPFQTVLVVLPIALIVAMPEGLVHEDRHLVMAFLLYVLALLFTFRIYHLFAARLVGAAATMRRFLITVTRLSNLAPIFVLWLLGRLASTIVLAWFGSDVDLTMNLEQAVFSTLLGDAVVPDSSFLDLMTALAVIPLSVHATLACLEGGGLTVPRWLRPSEEREEHAQEVAAQRRQDRFQAIVEAVQPRVPLPLNLDMGRAAPSEPTEDQSDGNEADASGSFSVRGLG
ncbi:MAG TPA: hypothetical protein HA286_03600 [Candidatus Poseidoniaceae archaeon]|nr:MAG TPA: hypothetical protein D7H96_03535 [Candidatus Poseidoniales archaeon]HIH53342.1 hypothetical protein [Candidatus Poseidoniaceae archaeon]